MKSHFSKRLITPILLFSLLVDVPLATSTTCRPSIFDQLRKIDESRFEYDGSIVGESLPATLVSAASWLTAMQLMRQMGREGPMTDMFDEAFLLTMPIDLGLTSLSHYISLGQIPWLKKLMDGQLGGEGYEFPKRSLALSTMGFGVISVFWGIAGVPLNESTLCAAGALCLAAYPVFLTVKNTLFKRVPQMSDRRSANRMQSEFPEVMQPFYEAALKRAEQLEVPEKKARAMFTTMLDALVTSRPYEELIGKHEFLLDIPGIVEKMERVDRLVDRLEAETRPRSVTRIAQKLRRARRALLNTILEESEAATEAERDIIAEVLDLGPEFTAEESLGIHQELADRHRDHRRWLRRASFIDQMISVGIGGGIFLYGLNEWAATGATPWWFLLGL